MKEFIVAGFTILGTALISISQGQATATKRSFTTNIFTTHVNHVTTAIKKADESTETFNGTDTPTVNSTGISLQSNRNQLVTWASANQYATKAQDHKYIKQKEEENEFGVEVGLPVGLCMALVFGILLSIYICRRYKCLKTNTDASTSSNRKAESLGSRKSSTRKVIAYFNASYEASEEISIEIKELAKHNESKYPNTSKKHHTDTNSEYAAVSKNNLRAKTTKSPWTENKSGKRFNSNKDKRDLYCYAFGNEDNCANSNEVQAAEYSFAKETGKEVTEDNYDVTGNVLSCSSNISINIYNQFQGEEYDSSVNVRTGSNCNHMYDMNQRSESVYDSTRSDNVYNKLFQPSATENQN